MSHPPPLPQIRLQKIPPQSKPPGNDHTAFEKTKVANNANSDVKKGDIGPRILRFLEQKAAPAAMIDLDEEETGSSSGTTGTKSLGSQKRKRQR